ncbi:MAG: hypothetical protein GXO48_02710 [Chlorobi bacterium]|nr:hypothetical protein [Chlorobiota bacterium]
MRRQGSRLIQLGIQILAFFFLSTNFSLAQDFGWHLLPFPSQDGFGMTFLIGSEAHYLIIRTGDTNAVARLDTASLQPQWITMYHNNTNRNWYRGAVIINDTIVMATWRAGGDDLMEWIIDGQTGNLISAQIWTGGDIQPGAIESYPDGSVIMSTEQLIPWATLVKHDISNNTFISRGWRIDNCGHMRTVNAIGLHSQGTNPDIYNAATCAFSQWGIARLSPNLNLRWAISLTLPTQTGTTIDPFVVQKLLQINDRVLMLGRVTQSVHGVGNGQSDAFIIAVDTNGTFLWARTYGGPWSEWPTDMIPNPTNSNEVLISMGSERGNGVFAGSIFRLDVNTGLVVNDSALVFIDTLTDIIPYDLVHVPGKGIFIAGRLYGTTPAIGFFPENIEDIYWCTQRIPIATSSVTMTINTVSDTGGGLSPTSVTPSVWTSTLSHDTVCMQPCSIVLDSVKNVLCNGDSNGTAYVSISIPLGSSYQVQWSNGDTGLIGDSLWAGAHWVSLSTPQCTDTIFFTITEPPPLEISSIDTFNPTSCSNPDGWIKVNVTGGTPPYTHQWNNSQNTDSIGGLSGGTYTDTITDANGCIIIATASLDSARATFEVNFKTTCIQSDPLQINASASFTGGTPPYSIYWNHISDTTSQIVISSGAFPFVAYDASGCPVYDTLIIPTLLPPPSLQLYPSVDSVFWGDTITVRAEPINLVQWSWSTSQNQNAENSFIITQDTIVYVYGQDSLGCSYVDSAIFYVLPSRVFFPSVFSPNGDGIHDVLRPVIYGYVPIRWHIYNRWGQLIFEGDEASQWDGTIKGSPAETERYVLIYWVLNPTTKEPLEKHTMSLFLIR